MSDFENIIQTENDQTPESEPATESEPNTENITIQNGDNTIILKDFVGFLRSQIEYVSQVENENENTNHEKVENKPQDLNEKEVLTWHDFISFLSYDIVLKMVKKVQIAKQINFISILEKAVQKTNEYKLTKQKPISFEETENYINTTLVRSDKYHELEIIFFDNLKKTTEELLSE